MKTSKINLIAILTIGAAVLAASNASAGGFSFGGGGGNKGGFKASFHGSNHNSSHNHHKHDHHHHAHHGHHGHHNHHHHVRYYTPPVRLIYSQCYHPHFQCCYVYPGDNWYTISKRVYGVDFLCKHIASYNSLSMSSPLVPGQMLRVPVVNANGSLATSNAPMPAPFAPQGMPFAAQGGPIGPQASMIGGPGSPNGFAPQGSPAGLARQGQPNGFAPQGQPVAPIQNGETTPSFQPSAAATPAAGIRTVAAEPTLPRVAIGSTLMLDGESLGTEQGSVRLEISGMTLPVEVIEWTATSVKVQLPKVDLSRPVKAQLEVQRADGSPASNSAIELTPAATRLALGN